MIYLYDSTRIDDLKEHFLESKRIDVTRLLSYDYTNLSEIEAIYKEIDAVNGLVIDLSALMNLNAYNSQYIGRVFFLLSRMSNSLIFWLNNLKYESIMKELPLLFEDEEINEEFASPEVQNFNPDDDTEDDGDIEFGDRIQEVVSNLIGHDVFKQDFVQKYANFILLERIGVRKIFSVFLIGESGIGKTEFAKILSKSLYPDEELIKINFGNYSTEGVLNSLIGSPLGYAGSDEGGELIRKINSSKSKVILIDEFEKATPAVFNFFYELLEDGKFTDRHGIAHNLNGYTIVFTSNMTSENYVQYIPAPLRSRFDLLSDFQIPNIDEKRLFIQEQTNSLVDKLNSIKESTYEIGDELMEEIMSFSEENNLRHIKRLVQDAIAEDFRRKHYGERGLHFGGESK
ncbi:AAA family ATPase [Streptococcus suis]|uniref:AAA family ATPase n=1 Tax=Streptococcus suis TaxID=1307 RepID=UPI000CF5D397|nr:AAA family ATPase [Streptococcus suis]MCE6986983.1 AAA family ATPase [Streptococcus suis]NQI44053.1 ATP-dependent Clp protease ATP-binding subunit [Streptococcus suis]NQK10361.1 ATP-dependent Clp protease ATP-binding subunit [Streptococcus suis]HEL1653050.1 ATP-dependent Clp protease ATP-binding subunit [Streptococcus suis]